MFNVTKDTRNKDIPLGLDRAGARDYYLDLWGDFESEIPDPTVEKFGDKWVLRADLAPGGLKAYGGERVIAECKTDTVTYCAPRQGHAMDAIALLSQKYGKKVVFFCPASKQVSDHQGALFAYPNVDMRFIKIAAMPVLNKYARDWAAANGATALPFGLAGNAWVTAGLVKLATRVVEQLGAEPTEVWCAVSTGTMIRALQIGWPNCIPRGVAVARNIHPGEIGDALVTSATIPFLKPDPAAKTMPFPSTAAYDAKAWSAFVENGAPGSIFINVGSDLHLNRNLSKVDLSGVTSQREWGDMGDMEENRAGVVKFIA